MPPRRPGGKYKGKVGRAKGEATLAAEAAERAKKMQEEYIRRMQEKREAELLAGSGLSSKAQEEEEARKQRILNMLMGGKKGGLKKFFRAWVTGKAIVRKQRLIDIRETGWRHSCGCLDYTCPGGCSSATRLRPPAFTLPFEASIRTGLDFSDTFAKPLWPSLSDLGVDRARSSSLPRLSGLRDTQGTTSKASLGASGSLAQLKPLYRSQDKLQDFIDVDNSDIVIHHATGRRMLLDSSEMKIGYADVARRTAPGFFNASKFYNSERSLECYPYDSERRPSDVSTVIRVSTFDDGRDRDTLEGSLI